MKHFTSLALALGLLLPVVVACGGAAVDEPTNSTDGTVTGASAEGPVESAESDVKSGKKKPPCPVLSPPSSSFCPDGKIVATKNARGCTTGYQCVKPTPAECPELSPPAPGFCTGGSVVPRYDSSTGCLSGFDCLPGATNACTAAGGTCVGLAPASCAAGHWADATTHSCGTGIGVGCCLP